MIWPLVVRRFDLHSLARLCIALMAVSLALRVAVRVFGDPPPTWIYLTPVRLDGLAVGALIAISLRDSSVRNMLIRFGRPAVLLALIIVGCVVASAWAPEPGLAMQTVGYSALSIVFGAPVFLATHRQQGRVTNWLARRTGLRALGRYSYGAYVYHLPLYWLLDRGDLLGRAGQAGYYAVAIPLTLMVAALSWHGIEQRFLVLARA